MRPFQLAGVGSLRRCEMAIAEAKTGLELADRKNAPAEAKRPRVDDATAEIAHARSETPAGATP